MAQQILLGMYHYILQNLAGSCSAEFLCLVFYDLRQIVLH